MNGNKHRFILIIAIALCTSLTFAETERSNIILIDCHDIGQHIGCYGVKEATTPNIDQLAKKGILFKNFYSTSGVCSPGRGSLLTGRYPQSNGLMGLTHSPFDWKLNEGEVHIASILQRNGYLTYLVGLQHITNGSTEKSGYQKHLSRQSKAEETVGEAIKIIQSSETNDKPFFIKIGFNEAHRPFHNGKDSTSGLFVPPYLQKTQEIKEDFTEFQAAIKYLDSNVGKIISALSNSKIAKNTIILFTSDHGIPYPGAKWTVRKAGIEVPFIIHQPGTILTGGKVFTDVMGNVDVLPTLLEMVDIEIPKNIEGKSFYRFLQGKGDAPRQAAFSQYTPDIMRDNLSRSIITERYHLIRYFDQGRSVVYPTDANPKRFSAHLERCKTGAARPFFQLFDLEKDPYELNDIGALPENRILAQKMSQELLAWMRQVNDPLLKGPLKTPYYTKAIEDFLYDD